jgi:hypothetical protein
MTAIFMVFGRPFSRFNGSEGLLQARGGYLGAVRWRAAMKGEFSRSTFSARMRYGNVTMQQGRVRLDTDWDEKSELQFHEGLVYLDVWEREVGGLGDRPLGRRALGGPDTGLRGADHAQDLGLRLVREVSRSGATTSLVHASLGRSEGSAAESFALPLLEVSVEGLTWARVPSLSGCGPRDKVYVLQDTGDGPSIVFGDGKCGERPPTGSRIVASYRFGDGNAPRKRGTPRKRAQ